MYALKQIPENHTNPIDLPALIDPTLLRAARQIYRFYTEVTPNLDRYPSGVVINRLTYRGKLVFSNQPILLPEEYFVPVNQIESEMY